MRGAGALSFEDGPLPLPRLDRRWSRWEPAWLGRRGNRVEYGGRLPPAAIVATLVQRGASDNHVVFGEGVRARRLSIMIDGTGNRIEIGRDVTVSGHIRVSGHGLTLRIGDRTEIKAGKIVAWRASVEIGRDCLFAGGVLVRTCDVHAIIDRGTGACVNPAADVRVGDGVWVALDAALMKGAVVPNGCVVGMRAVLTSPFTEPDCVIAGTPARVIRRNVAWTRYPFVEGDLPEGFEPARYLALHPDVAQAYMDPRQHYLVFGQREGRAYR